MVENCTHGRSGWRYRSLHRRPVRSGEIQSGQRPGERKGVDVFLARLRRYIRRTPDQVTIRSGDDCHLPEVAESPGREPGEMQQAKSTFQKGAKNGDAVNRDPAAPEEQAKGTL